MSIMMAVVDAWSITLERLPGKWRVWEIMPNGVFTAIHTVPTGLSAVPPSGPAMPEVAMAHCVASLSHAPVAISSTVGILTAPCIVRVSYFTFRTDCFTSLL